MDQTTHAYTLGHAFARHRDARVEPARAAELPLTYTQLSALVVTVWLAGAAGMALITIG